MNWEAMGAIGEVLGALGVIITLGYLAVQIRQNSKVIRASTRQAISTAQAELGYRLAQDADLRKAALRYTRLESTVSDADQASHIYTRALLRTFENQYHQYLDGTFDESLWIGYRNSMVQNFTDPGMAEYWSAHRAFYSAEFASFVESELLPSA